MKTSQFLKYKQLNITGRIYHVLPNEIRTYVKGENMYIFGGKGDYFRGSFLTSFLTPSG